MTRIRRGPAPGPCEIDASTASAAAGVTRGRLDEVVSNAAPTPTVTAPKFPSIATYSGPTVATWIETQTPDSTVQPDRPDPALSHAPATVRTSPNDPGDFWGCDSGTTGATTPAVITSAVIAPALIAPAVTALSVLATGRDNAVHTRAGTVTS